MIPSRGLRLVWLVPAAMVLTLSAGACSGASSDAVTPTTTPATSSPDAVSTTLVATPTSEVSQSVPETTPGGALTGLVRRTATGIEISEEEPVMEEASSRAIGADSADSRVAIDIPGFWEPPVDGADILVWVGDARLALVVFETGPEVSTVRATAGGRTLDEATPVGGLGPLAFAGDPREASYVAHRAGGSEVTSCGVDAELPALLTCD